MIKTETESVKIEKEQMERVRNYVKTSKHTIGGYVSMLIKKDMDRKENLKSNKK